MQTEAAVLENMLHQVSFQAGEGGDHMTYTGQSEHRRGGKLPITTKSGQGFADLMVYDKGNKQNENGEVEGSC